MLLQCVDMHKNVTNLKFHVATENGGFVDSIVPTIDHPASEGVNVLDGTAFATEYHSLAVNQSVNHRK